MEKGVRSGVDWYDNADADQGFPRVLPPCLPYPHPPLGRAVHSEDGVKGHLVGAALCPTSAEGEVSCSLSQLTNCQKVLEKGSDGEGRRKGTMICWVHSLSFIQQRSLSTDGVLTRALHI